MGEQDHLAALVGNLADSGSHALDAGRVGDLAVFDRHVEIDAHEHALARHVGFIERVEHVSAHCKRVRSACPSQPRLEKLNSFLYHDTTPHQRAVHHLGLVHDGDCRDSARRWLQKGLPRPSYLR